MSNQGRFLCRFWSQIWLSVRDPAERNTCCQKFPKYFMFGLISIHISWGGFSAGSEIDTVNDIDSGVNRFSPKALENIFAMQHNTCHLLNHSIFPFNHSILLWSFWCRELMFNAMLSAKRRKIRILKFLSMIGANS